ncbi:dTDP-glucose 4,6-dehydratase [Caulobacter sp. 17J65-9]|uniref:dTDP-glucose 4,6-dehydratase n=1 Tax=Caulobacter sp. 17J65-9 TaxID=2709382 RepID=UPI0013CCAD8E|nr:dTDP-glucose 4,6-dehydratase [Caulobacter sp. 17J65-9]
MRLLVTGGCGFIGSAVVRQAVRRGIEVINVDALTYAANPANVAEVEASPLYAFEKADVRDRAAMADVFARRRPDAVMHLAAESHVDRSIDGPLAFVETNALGAAVMLDAAARFRDGLPGAERDAFRFHHVSTDEVFGALGPDGAFDEASPYRPNSPYAASKAAADLLARAWGATYGLNVVTTNCSNNYGPFQHPEKLIPTVVLSALEGRPIPIYGGGLNVRDWLYVEDHAEALLLVLDKGRAGETYAIGARAEAANLDLARRLCGVLDTVAPRKDGGAYAEQISFVDDRPGHDFRYALDASKIQADLGWTPRIALDEGLEQTVRWMLDNPGWIAAARAGGFDGGRLGLSR